MKKTLLLATLLLVSTGAEAQKKNFSYHFYGQVRADVFYNSRANKESADGIVNYYPLDKALDAQGKDLNGTSNLGFYTLYSRLGLDVQGPDLKNGAIHTSAKMEIDFRGSSTSYSLARIRHMYLQLDWKNQSLLVGQAWHPFYGDVAPEVLSLDMGAPFQPFSRAPQVRYQVSPVKGLTLRGAALWQTQYVSYGLDNKTSEDLIKKSCTPEFLIGLDYTYGRFTIGANAEMLSITPRTQATGQNGQTYKVKERLTSFSGELHMKYKTDRFAAAAKTVLGSNMTQLSTLGGFGITHTDAVTGEQEYSPLRTSATWASLSYGTRLRGTVIGGYYKNLGACDEVSGTYGNGTDIDQMFMAGANLIYNLPNWKFGIEYTARAADYGQKTGKGRVSQTHRVTNHRAMATAIFMF